MKKIPAIACLFVDIGGVLVSNGWDDPPHKLAAEKFHLDLAEMNERHQLLSDTCDEGKITLEEYLGRAGVLSKTSATHMFHSENLDS